MQTRQLTRMALFTALTAVLSQIIVPLPFTPVPVSMATAAVMLCGALLTPRMAFLSQAAYLLLGMAGAPVFSGFGGGLAKVAGPTGGYLLAYPLMALLTALLIQRFGQGKTVVTIAAMLVGLALCYLGGSLWLAVSTGRTLVEALMAGVVPFIAADIAKAVLATVVARALPRSVVQMA